MTFTVFLAVIGAAFLHALWNAIVRAGTSKQTTMLVMTVVQGFFGVALALSQPWPHAHIWPWLIASGVVHMAYKLFLTFAYEHGDLSRVYPIARGAAPLMVLAVSAVWISDEVSATQSLGIIILGIGILIMGHGAFKSGESRALVPLALCSALATAAYSIIDGMGARIAGNATQFVAWLFILDAMFFVPTLAALRGRRALIVPRNALAAGSFAAAASFFTYMIVVWAMTISPIALVTALRETSIVFAVLIGLIVFKEKFDGLKILSVTLIVTGVIATRI